MQAKKEGKRECGDQGAGCDGEATASRPGFLEQVLDMVLVCILKGV